MESFSLPYRKAGLACLAIQLLPAREEHAEVLETHQLVTQSVVGYLGR